jgi:hypothetical protein
MRPDSATPVPGAIPGPILLVVWGLAAGNTLFALVTILAALVFDRPVLYVFACVPLSASGIVGLIAWRWARARRRRALS